MQIYRRERHVDASLEDFRPNNDASIQKIKSWDEQSEPNPEQRKGEENIMGILFNYDSLFT